MVRNTPILASGATTQRAPRRGMSSTEPIGNQRIALHRRCLQLGRGERPELVLVLARDALGPRVELGKSLAENEAVEITLAPIGVAHDLTPDLIDTDTLGPLVDA